MNSVVLFSGKEMRMKIAGVGCINIIVKLEEDRKSKKIILGGGVR